ncbi:hypothetical protein KKB44_02525 [Candidatus Micrarchaeota archaeon]|nr:hypothetical protein [Candidatus Micrarchaeota archaeon]
MGGSSLRYTEPFNSSSRESSTGRRDGFLRRAARYAVLTTTALGAFMTGNGVITEARAEEQRVEFSVIRDAQTNLALGLDGIRGTLIDQRDAEMPVGVGYSDPNVVQLLRTIEGVNEQLRPHNGGQDVVPLTGTTDQEKFQSLNRWLGRDETAPIDFDALSALEARLTMEVMGLASAVGGAQEIVATVGGEAPVVAQEAPPVVEEEAPVVINTEQRTHYESIAADLDVIAQYGRTQDRTQAGQYRDQIREQLASDNPDLEALAQVETNSQSLRDRRLAAAQANRDEAQQQELAQAADQAEEQEGRPFALTGDLLQIQRDLQAIQDSQPIAAEILTMLPRAYLCGPGTREQYVRFLGEARNALTAEEPNLVQARERVESARAIDQREQTLYALFLRQVIIPGATVYSEALAGSTVPTEAQMQEFETRDEIEVPGRRTSTRDRERMERNRYYRTSNGIHNGREQLVNPTNVLLTTATQYLEHNEGNLSFNYVWDLYQSLQTNGQAVTFLIDVWDYAQAHGINDAPVEVRRNFMQAYAVAALTFADPEFNPYPSYPEGLRRLLFDQYREATGNRDATDADVMAALMRSHHTRVQDALIGVYQWSATLAPELSGDVATSISRLRAGRMVYMEEYEPYIRDRYSGVTDAQRLEDTRYFLTNAVQLAEESGMSSEDDLIQYARAQLAINTDDYAPEQLQNLADRYYAMSLDLLAIREAELWLANPDLCRTAPELDRARGLITEARMVFEWNFSHPEVESTFYSFLSRNIADEVTTLLAPFALSSIESHATYLSLTAIDNAQSNVMDYLFPEGQERTLDEDPVAYREAVIADREAAFIAATSSEQNHLRMLVSLRTDRDFGPLPLVPTTWENDLEVLSPQLGRAEVVGSGVDISLISVGGERSRLTLAPADPGRAIIGGGQYRRELAALYPQGHAFAEIHRQTLLHIDEGAPALLRQMNADGFRTTLDGIAERYDQPQVLTQSNALLNEILRTRLDELETRLGSRREDGVVISTIPTRSDDPHAYYVVRAQEAQRNGRRHLERFNTNLDSDLFEGQVDPRMAIMEVEAAIASLSPEFVDGIPVRDVEEQITATLEELSFYVPSTDIRIDRSGSRPVRVRFTAEQVMVRQDEGAEVSLEEYERSTGSDITLTYNWFIYQSLGQSEDVNATRYLLNPSYLAEGEQRYIGQVMRNVTLTDGTTGDFVVRVRPSGMEPTEGPEWLPLTELNGRVRPENVLYQLYDGTLEPMRGSLLNEHLDEVARRRTSNVNTVNEYGPTIPVVIVSPTGMTLQE